MKELREIINGHLHEIKAGHADKLESQIKAWIEENVIGEDEKMHQFNPSMNQGILQMTRESNYLADNRNQLRQSQRQQLREEK